MDTLGEYVEIINGGTPKTSNPSFWNGDIPWISIKDFSNKYIDNTEKTITEDGLRNSSTSLLNSGDIIISARGTVGKLAVLKKPMAFNQSCFGIRTKSNLLRQDYLYYLLLNKFQLLQQLSHGSVFSTITRDTLNNLEIQVPPVEIQARIADLLSSIDDKIEVNIHVNDNLTQQVNAIYEYMFITNADSSWKTGKLSDIVTVRYGKDHKKIADGIYPVYGSGGIMRYVERPLYDKESVLIPRKGTLNNVIYVNQPFWSVDTMFYTEMRIPNVAKFVYNYVKAKNLSALNSGSAVPSMTTDILNAIELVIPSNSALEKFEEVVSPLYKEMQKNNRQSEILGKLRDILLPRLISGEIVIP